MYITYTHSLYKHLKNCPYYVSLKAENSEPLVNAKQSTGIVITQEAQVWKFKSRKDSYVTSLKATVINYAGTQDWINSIGNIGDLSEDTTPLRTQAKCLPAEFSQRWGIIPFLEISFSTC